MVLRASSKGRADSFTVVCRFLAVCATVASCGRSRAIAREADADVASPAAVGVDVRIDSISTSAGRSLSPLRAESWLVELPVQGFRDARVSVPLGAKDPRPIIVALHGAGDRPEWACGGWRGASDAYSFIVCPTGRPGGAPGGFVWGNDAEVEREVGAAVDATRNRFGPYVAKGCTLLAGFSQGAIRMAPILARGGEWCPQALFCEGAYDLLDRSFARTFVERGGGRLLLGCSQPYCAKVFGQREAALRQAGLNVRTVYSGGRTHNLNGEMVSTLREAWPWLVRDDERWSGYLEERGAK